MPDDPFELWLGRIGRDRPLARRLHGAVNRAGGSARGRRGGFTGARIGRGAGIGRMLSTSRFGTGASHRRVVVKARIVRLGTKGLPGAVAHLRYLQRDGTTREGGRGTLYGPGADTVDGRAFLDRGRGDRHQFRFIVAPEDGADYPDLKPLVRRWMRQVGEDLGTRLDWVAVDHHNTGHPHAHVILRGTDERGRDLVIARDYLTQGLRARAVELVDLDLGPRSPEEIERSRRREIDQERLTGIDRRLLAARNAAGLVSAGHRDRQEQALRAGRLQVLARLELAVEKRPGLWRLDHDIEQRLRRMGERGDIIRTLQRAMREHVPERPPSDQIVYEPEAGRAGPVVGRVIERGLSDEHADRQYLIVDGTDGLCRYVDIGVGAPATGEGSIVRISPAAVQIRAVDRTVAEIAAAHGGRYDIDIHLRHDPQASQAFAETHVRRLEAMRRATRSVERQPNGTWIIAPDHLDRVEAWERSRIARNPVTIETLSSRALDTLPHHDGVTWLDREMASAEPVPLGRGFGAEVRRAMVQRQQWLVEQQLAEQDSEQLRLKGDVLAVLRQRELRRVAGQLSEELGLPFVPPKEGEPIEGIYRRAVAVGDSRYALIEKSREFTLVPWRPVLERAVDRPVAGVMRDGAEISWTIGRSRGLGVS